jgi:hypothetical protein
VDRSGLPPSRDSPACACWPPSISEDLAAGQKLLKTLLSGLADTSRLAGYLNRQYTHAVLAEVYPLLLVRRRKGVIGRPHRGSDDANDLMRRVVGWIQ